MAEVPWIKVVESGTAALEHKLPEVAFCSP
jgi:hypothetical protein